MKTAYVMIASGAAGVALGVGITWADFGHVPPLETTNLIAAPGVRKPDQAPQLVVDHMSHDFGLIDRDQTVTHRFRFTNVGTATLTLKRGTTTCTACTITELSRTEVAPGETAEVVVEYSPRTSKPEFQQYATVLTNDPEHPRVELLIRGSVSRKFHLVPDGFVFSNVSASEPATAAVKILYYLGDKLRVVDHAFNGRETASFFEAASEPIPRDALTDSTAKSGVRVLVTLKKGLPLGPFRQTIRLTLEFGESSERREFEVPIEGKVVSDVSIVGPGWHADTGILSIGNVKSDQGAKRRLYVLARGDARRDVEIEPVELDPPWLRVTMGEPVELTKSVIRIPMTVEIPPGRPPAIFTGTDQGKYGVIVLGIKNHPDAREIRMHLKFVIENEG